MLDFDPDREPVRPRPAATVLVVRSSDDHLELFCVKRHRKSGFLGGAVVFPGGKVDAADQNEDWGDLTTGLCARSHQFTQDNTTALAFAVAALRESLEEAAILPVVGDTLTDGEALTLRAELAARVAAGVDNAFLELIREHRLKLDTARLVGLWRWVTPTAEVRRFDTPFYVLPLPAGQKGQHDQHETTEGFWGTPRRLLGRWEAGEIFMAPPTVRCLEVLGSIKKLAELDALTARYSLDSLCPHLLLHDNKTILALPGDPLFPETAPTATRQPDHDPTAPTRFVLEETRFVGRRVESS